MWRVTALVKRRDGLDEIEFDQAWTKQLVPALQTALEKQGAVQRLVFCLPPPALSEQVTQAFPPQFDGMLAIWFARATDATAAFAALARDESLHEIAAQVVAADDSVAFMGKAIPPVIDDEANVTLVAGSDIAKDLSLQEAQDYFVNVHPRVAQSAPEVWRFLTRFAQFCGDPTTTVQTDQWLAKYRFIPLAFDMGVADADDFIGMYSHPSYMSIIRPDEQAFSDAASMVGYLAGQEIVLLDGTTARG